MKTSRSRLGLLAGLALAACSAPDGATFALQPPTPEAVAEFLRYSRQFTRDHEPSLTPAHLGRSSDIVVTGTIVGVEAGQSYAPTPDSRARISTSVLEITVDRIVAGDDAAAWDDSVFVEVPHPAYVGVSEISQERVPFDRASFAASVLRSYGIFFLVDRTEEPYWETIIDEGRGRPVGARLTGSHVQGFLIEDDHGRLWSVNEPLEAMPQAWRDLKLVEEVRSQVDAS